MELKQSNLIKVVPQFMRNDKTIKALAKGIDAITTDLSSDILHTWNEIDNMGAADLDELAWELNVLWYNAAGSIEQKAIQIKTSDEIWRTLGTRYAVEQVISLIFGNAKLLEFWEYPEGKPHHVKITLDKAGALTEANTKEFLRIFEIVKRKSQILDSIELVMEQDYNLYAGMVVHEVDTEETTFKQQKNQFIGPYDFTGMALQDSTTEIHNIGG